jgi:hypothetical protein
MHDFIEQETFSISNGWRKEWVNLTKEELMKIPWIRDAIENPACRISFNCDISFHIQEITNAGAIHLVNPDDPLSSECDIIRLSQSVSDAIKGELTHRLVFEVCRHNEMNRDDSLWGLKDVYIGELKTYHYFKNGTITDCYDHCQSSCIAGCCFETTDD